MANNFLLFCSLNWLVLLNRLAYPSAEILFIKQESAIHKLIYLGYKVTSLRERQIFLLNSSFKNLFQNRKTSLGKKMARIEFLSLCVGYKNENKKSSYSVCCITNEAYVTQMFSGWTSLWLPHIIMSNSIQITEALSLCAWMTEISIFQHVL